MADVFEIDPSHNYHHRKDSDDYRRGWVSTEGTARKDPRLTARRNEDRSRAEKKPKQLYDKLGVPISPLRKQYSRSPSPRRDRSRHKMFDGGNSPKKVIDHKEWNSPQRLSKHTPQVYTQPPPNQPYQQTPAPVYNESYASYPPGTYQQGYGQSYSAGYGQYEASSYPQQSYGSSHAQGQPVGEYPGGWAPVATAYSNVTHQAAGMRSAPPPVPPVESKPDDGKKEAAIAQELKQQRATLLKQREEYLRKASVLRRELEKLRAQKHDLLCERSPTRDSQRILRENGKLQLEIQNKLKSITNVVDMLTGIIGDGLKATDEEGGASPGRPDEPHSYVHFDPETHWCRTCDVFPQTAKDYLSHLHSAQHRQVMQERQLVDTPWHKLPAEPEMPTCKGAPVKRVPIKGLQFFVPATAWYCKLCDAWIGDLHCASAHLKSKAHSHNYANFIAQNAHWEATWKKDREKAHMRSLKNKGGEDTMPAAPEPPLINEKRSKKLKEKLESSLFDIVHDNKKKKKKSKKRKQESSGSSSSSSSSDSSSEEDSDRSKSIRVAMRNKMIQAQRILNEEIGDKWEVLGRLVEEERHRTKDSTDKKVDTPGSDDIINQWMTVNNTADKSFLENLKGRLKQRQEADKDKALKAINEQRKREREREERELREIREREQKELEEKLREEREREERDRLEREKIKERERSRRKKPISESSPDRFLKRSRSRSRSVEHKKRPAKVAESKMSPPESKFKPRVPPPQVEEPHKLDTLDKSKEKRSSGSRKLPFIGRMPLYKKKGDGDEKENQKDEDYEFRPSKFEHGSSARAFIPAPGVVHITRLATPVDPSPKLSADNPPPPPKIVPEPPKISGGQAPPPPRINDVVTSMSERRDNPDMELEGVGPPAVPHTEGKPLTKPGGHLPRDFQDALNIIFPGDQRPDMLDSNSLMAQYQYYGMMYPGMHMYDYSSQTNDDDELMPEPQPAAVDNKADLAMLGIDVGDMAAQTI